MRSSQESTDGHLSHTEGDEDYSPPHNSRPVTSHSRSILDENALQYSQNIGMSSIANANSHLNLMHKLAIHLANPKHWVPAYEEVKNIQPENLISVAVLDFFLSCESHRSRTSIGSAQCFYYVDQNTVEKMTGDSEEDQSLLRNCLAIKTGEIPPAPILILITTGHNTYFLAMFDFLQAKALILGRRGLAGSDFTKAYAEWGSWNGRMLWQQIYNALIWPASEEIEREPIAYETDLIPVLKFSSINVIILTYLYVSSAILTQVPEFQDFYSFSMDINGIGMSLYCRRLCLRSLVTINPKNMCSIQLLKGPMSALPSGNRPLGVTTTGCSLQSLSLMKCIVIPLDSNGLGILA